MSSQVDYSKGVPFDQDLPTSVESHEYIVDWNADRIVWSIDGLAVRTVTREEADGKYPNTKSRIQLAVWDGGAGALGTRIWAGGYVDWNATDSKGYPVTIDYAAITCAGDTTPSGLPARKNGYTAPTLTEEAIKIAIPSLDGSNFFEPGTPLIERYNCGGGCGNSKTPTPAPTGPPSLHVFCFSGDCEVEVENKGSVKMSDLALGDYVKVVDNKYEPVYSFGHKDGESSAEFLQIVTKGNRRPLEISKDHMVVVEGGRHVPASSVKRGDNLVTADGDLVVVKTIRTVMRKGIYAPFTASGSIIVNDIAASNYVAFQGSEYLQIAGFDTPFSFHWLAHIFNSVHRVAVMIGFSGESYTATGVSQWVALPHKCGSWLLEQNAVFALAILLPSIALFGLVSVIEALMNSPMILATLVVGALTLVVARRTVSVKTMKM